MKPPPRPAPPDPARRRALLALAAAPVALGTACHGGPPNPNPRASVPLVPVAVDLSRYMGRWYVIAHLPYWAERGFVASRAEWTLRPDGRIDDRFIARRGFDGPERRYHFVDTALPGGGEWRVQLLWPIHVTQLTLFVDADYRTTLLGYHGKHLGWVFAREPELDETTYRGLLDRFDGFGYDTSRFLRVPQTREQLGRPGFESVAG